jgi:flagella basal body P-ring formation protein FlgA
MMAQARILFKSRLLVVACALFCFSTFVQAQEASYVTSKVVIYPGEVIRKENLIEAKLAKEVREMASYPGIDDLVGKIAVVSIRPNEPIRGNMVRAPAVFVVGAVVMLRYKQNGISITASGMALQNGFVGQRARIRNQESGATIVGVVMQDGGVQID